MLPRRSFILVLLMAGGVSCAGIDNRADGGGRADAADDASGFSLDVRLSADPRPCEVEGAMRINPRPADVLVLLDRSGSMDMAFGSSSRYRALASQLSDLVTAYQSHVRFGYIEMPGKSGCETQSPGCCASPPPVELALDNAQAVTAAIAQAWPVGGNTPTAAALLAASQLPYLSSPTFNYDYDMSYRESTLIQRRAIRYVEMSVGLDKPILSIFPPIFGLEDPRYGYSEGKFASVSHLYAPNQQYILGSQNTSPYYPPAGLRVELVETFSAPNYMNLYFYKILR